MLHWLHESALGLSAFLPTTIFSATARGGSSLSVVVFSFIILFHVGILKVAINQGVTANVDERL